MVKVSYGVRLDSLIFYNLRLSGSQKVATLLNIHTRFQRAFYMPPYERIGGAGEAPVA